MSNGQVATSQDVDFGRMILGSGNSEIPLLRELVGAPKDAIRLPSKWADMQGSECIQVLLQPGSTEYIKTLKEFTDSGLLQGSHYTNINQIYRLQNPTLYKQFQVQKIKVENKLKGNRNIEVSRHLFHGTKESAVNSILVNGFDRSHAGRVSLGRGIYFAKAASYSHGFTQPAINGKRQMFLVEVITGEHSPVAGNSGTSAIPIKQGTNEAYDCVVDNPSNPSAFVVFKDSSAYALYLLEYS